jgi:mRNA-degrading endonuclease RelE of RelBE toxin-antitoxin system
VKKNFKDIRHLPEFEKDFKKLSKKFRSLDDDLKTFIETALNLCHNLKIPNNSIVQIPNLGIESPKIFKARKFACKSLKGKGAMSGIRVIYAYYEKDDIIEFIEIYYKADQTNENKERILKNYLL